MCTFVSGRYFSSMERVSVFEIIVILISLRGMGAHTFI